MACHQLIKKEREEFTQKKREQNHYIRFQENIKRLKVQKNLKDKLNKYTKTFVNKLEFERQKINEKMLELENIRKEDKLLNYMIKDTKNNLNVRQVKMLPYMRPPTSNTTTAKT